MINVKNKDFLLALFSTVIIVATGIFYLKAKKIANKPLSETTLKVKEISLPSQSPEIMWLQASTKGPSYNYDNLLRLIKNYRKIETNFYKDYQNFITNAQNMNKVELTLNNLKKEKERFYSHLRQLKSFHRRGIPSKKITASRYYLRTLEKGIDILEDINKKFSFTPTTLNSKN